MVVYLTTHITSGKMYIGRDKNNYHRYFGSGVEIKKIIKEEGKTNLRKSILSECKNEIELALKEEYWLNFYDAENNPKFLNKTNKAYGCSRQTEEGKRKIKENRGSLIWSEERKKKFSKTRTGKKRIQNKIRNDKGEKRNENWKRAISQSTKGVSKPNKWKEVEQYNLNGELIKTYPSASHAKKETNLKIQNALTGISKNCGGYIWKYKE